MQRTEWSWFAFGRSVLAGGSDSDWHLLLPVCYLIHHCCCLLQEVRILSPETIEPQRQYLAACLVTLYIKCLIYCVRWFAVPVSHPWHFRRKRESLSLECCSTHLVLFCSLSWRASQHHHLFGPSYQWHETRKRICLNWTDCTWPNWKQVSTVVLCAASAWYVTLIRTEDCQQTTTGMHQLQPPDVTWNIFSAFWLGMTQHTLQTAAEVRKWIPSIKRDIFYCLRHLSGIRNYRETKMAEFQGTFFIASLHLFHWSPW